MATHYRLILHTRQCSSLQLPASLALPAKVLCPGASVVTVLYCTLLYCTVLYCIVLYCTVLYFTVLYCTVQYRSSSMPQDQDQDKPPTPSSQGRALSSWCVDYSGLDLYNVAVRPSNPLAHSIASTNQKFHWFRNVLSVHCQRSTCSDAGGVVTTINHIRSSF